MLAWKAKIISEGFKEKKKNFLNPIIIYRRGQKHLQNKVKKNKQKLEATVDENLT